jgi:hypothetical protein
MSTRAQLLRDYLSVTPASAPGLYTSSFVGGQHGAARIKTRLTTRVPGHPDITREEQAAWLWVMVEHRCFQKLERDGECYGALWFDGEYCQRDGGDTPDAACLAALLAADREFAAKWEAAG